MEIKGLGHDSPGKQRPMEIKGLGHDSPVGKVNRRRRYHKKDTEGGGTIRRTQKEEVP